MLLLLLLRFFMPLDEFSEATLPVMVCFARS